MPLTLLISGVLLYPAKTHINVICGLIIILLPIISTILCKYVKKWRTNGSKRVSKAEYSYRQRNNAPAYDFRKATLQRRAGLYQDDRVRRFQ